eukprot:3797104-Amphidinium_carterae.1
MFKWARELGAVSFAHWFFPMRGGGGAPGGAVGAFKMETCSICATRPYRILQYGLDGLAATTLSKKARFAQHMLDGTDKLSKRPRFHEQCPVCSAKICGFVGV